MPEPAHGLVSMVENGKSYHVFTSVDLTSFRVELHPGDYVTISASRFPFPSVLPLERRGNDWVASISRTLQWNSRQKQKAFDDNKKDKRYES